ncbi:concanavalin A-like lectin/glucanase [Artomyces pyxidatus]|uniref:Concanavalin A-like lectin/glucanase n=1 Tax=Artomyces pyxidatus TaxID=48021 RepID=A0ACB8SUI3_9AGAM|nr:concanavalin A-like lectin/glucanase [Artomyces pyxidatus]
MARAPTFHGRITAALSCKIAVVNFCAPFSTTFSPGSVSPRSSDASTPFVAVSPEGSYRADGDGLQLYLQRPPGRVTTAGGVNDKVADGATINSTFVMLHGKVTYEMSAPRVAGVVTAAILIADQHDEIDVELVAGDPSHWQTNVYAPSPADKEPLWGVFGDVEDFPNKQASITATHKYTIDWTSERIIWSVDGHAVRTLTPDQTQKNGAWHYPSHPARIQLGIWDASSPQGTAEWAKGPIDWQRAPEEMVAVVHSVVVECP